MAESKDPSSITAKIVRSCVCGSSTAPGGNQASVTVHPLVAAVRKRGLPIVTGTFARRMPPPPGLILSETIRLGIDKVQEPGSDQTESRHPVSEPGDPYRGRTIWKVV